MSDVIREVREAESVRQRQRGGSNTLIISLLCFVALVAAGVWAAYTYGDGHIYIDGRGMDELSPLEVVAGVVVGIIGAIVGILAGIVGVLIGLAAALLAILLALMGVATGLFITIGVLAGPILLLAAIIMLINRSSKKEPLEEAYSEITETAETAEA